MAICQYFLRGQCRFGDACRNEHPQAANATGQEAFANQTWNTNRNPSNNHNDQKLSLPFTAESITNDLTPHRDKPLWPLSSFGAAKHEPLLLAGLDEAPEELRVKAATAKNSGNFDEYVSYENAQISAAENVYMNARTNSAHAYNQAVKQSNLPALIASVTGNPPSSSSTFGNPAPTLEFGVPTGAPAAASAFNTSSTSPFGTSTRTSAFGDVGSIPSAFGNTSTTSAFGKPAFGQPQAATSTFGQQISQPGSAFGQPSFGQPAPTQTSSFIKPASGAFSAFANQGPSAFATAAAANNTGGGFSVFAGQPSTFGTAAAPGSTNPTGSVFGQTGFGTSTTSAPAASAFGTPDFSSPSPFRALSQQQPGANAISPFGGAFESAFASQPVSAFGQPQQPAPFSQPQSVSSAFSSSATQIPSAFTAFPIDPPSTSNPFGEPKPLSSGTKIDFASAKFDYRPGLTPYDSQLPPNYMEILPETALASFRSSKFEWGKVPEWVPPLETRAKGIALFS